EHDDDLEALGAHELLHDHELALELQELLLEHPPRQLLARAAAVFGQRYAVTFTCRNWLQATGAPAFAVAPTRQKYSPGFTVLPKSVLPHQPKVWCPAATSRRRVCLIAFALAPSVRLMRRITLCRLLRMKNGSFVQRGAPFAEIEIVGGCACWVVTASAVAGKTRRTAVAMMNRCMETSRESGAAAATARSMVAPHPVLEIPAPRWARGIGIP